MPKLIDVELKARAVRLVLETSRNTPPQGRDRLPATPRTWRQIGRFVDGHSDFLRAVVRPARSWPWDPFPVGEGLTRVPSRQGHSSVPGLQPRGVRRAGR